MVNYYKKIIIGVVTIIFHLGHLYANGLNLRFSHLNNTNGLSNNTIYCILQDYKGFMWFGAEDGLNMYNGYEFVVFNTNIKDTNSISSNTIFDLHEDKKGNLWIATNNGIDVFNRESLTFKHVPVILDKDTIVFNTYARYLFTDNNNNILVASSLNFWRIFIYDAIKKGFVELNIETNDYKRFQREGGIETVLIDSKNRVWVGPRTFNSGLFAYDLNTKKLIASPYSNKTLKITDKIYTINEHPDGDIWIGTGNGIYVVNSDLSGIKHIIINKDIVSDYMLEIYFDGRDNVWLGTRTNGMVLYNIPDKSYKKYNQDKNDKYSINNNSVYSVYKDKQDILWVGTVQGGVNFAPLKNDKKFGLLQNNPDNANSLANNVICSIFEDSDGDVWLGTDGGGLDLYNPKNKKFNHFVHNLYNANSISGNSVLTLNQDKNGKIWVGGYLLGVNILDKKTNNIVKYKYSPDDKNSLSNDDVRHIYIDKKNNVWIATSGGGLNLFDPVPGTFKRFQNNQSTNSIVSDWCLRILEDSYGKMWIGTYGGLSVYDPVNNVFTNYISDGAPGSISDNWVYAIHEDKDKNMWIGTTKGLNLFNRETATFTSISKLNGLPNDVINGILEDNKNNLWLSTNKGISKYNTLSGEVKNYDYLDGLQGEQYVHGAYFINSSGKMYFGGINGLTMFYPDSIGDNNYEPGVYFTDFLVFYQKVDIHDKNSPLKKSITETDTIVFSYNQSVITFKYAALNYVNPEKNQYKYKLSGFDDEWHFVGNRREATFTNLDPGKYKLSVMATNNDGVWSDKVAVITIIILPPWWQTWFFRISFIIIILASFTGFYFHRVRTMKKRQIYLENVVRERTMEIEKQNDILNETNTTLEERQQQIEEQAEELRVQKEELEKVNENLNETNVLLEERQQRIEEQKEELMAQKEELIRINESLNENNTILEERQQRIEEQKEALKVQAEELSNANKELEEMNKTKDRFFSIIAHDLKNPFNTIFGFAQLLQLRKSTLTEEKRDLYIDSIFSSSKKIFALLENLLQWSRMQSNRIQFNPVEFLLNAVANDAVLLLKENASQKQITVKNKIEGSIKCYADIDMINTVIRNLVSNSIKYTPVEGEISIKATVKEKYVEVEVADNGVGISPKILKDLFKIDKNTSTAGTQGEEGTGLGLILCQDFIKRNGGEIRVESEEGKGAAFIFTIPVA